LLLKSFLEAKPLYYDKIDYTRMPRVYESIKKLINIPKIIHLIGTNAKGTTGRFLASSLNNIGFDVGHYTSPHILKFNERIWINGEDVTDNILQKAHETLQNILTKDDSTALSYFEYTTFLAMIIFQNCDYIVLEAGLGGEFDATAVFPKILTLVTPIALDHEAFLGSDIKQIAQTKLNAIQNNAIFAKQNDEVYEIAKTLNKNIFKVDSLLTKNDLKKIEIISDELLLVDYLKENLSLSIAALNFLEINYKTSDFKNAKLFGRLSKICENIIVDVGHNELAASSVLSALSGNKYIIIYNSFKDKNYKNILQILKPIISSIEIIKVDDSRIESAHNMQNVLNKLNIKYSSFKEIKKEKNYLVFGSFSVVEAFLKEYHE